MTRYFLESSALVKRYKQEPATDVVDGLFAGDDELYYLNLAVIESSQGFLSSVEAPAAWRTCGTNQRG